MSKKLASLINKKPVYLEISAGYITKWIRQDAKCIQLTMFKEIIKNIFPNVLSKNEQ